MPDLERPAWDVVWMNVAESIAPRSRCSLRQIGAVIVDVNNRPVAMGYNGPPARYPAGDGESCTAFCPRAQDGSQTVGYGNCVSIHAEANALLFADRREYAGGTLYVTSVPCWDCGKLIANSGIRKVVFPMPEERDAHRRPEETITMLQISEVEVALARIR